ncbi:MAG: helix-turn-helix transcriptional regulator [Clostridia bacterium]|nr:helix-turn-helix transcriptional regulator [Clostridia bacterium]
MKQNLFSPITESMYYILLSLSEPLHGYGIIKKVEEMSQGRLKLAPGTLYGALTNLENNKLIISVGVDPENIRRKLYKITDSGVDLIQIEIKRLEELLRNGKKVYYD